MKIIRRTGKNVSVGRIVRAEMAKIVDANLERIKRAEGTNLLVLSSNR